MFGPVITKVLKLFPREISIGTTLSLSIRGCLADFNEIMPLLFIIGLIASISYANFPLENIKSILAITFKFEINSGKISKTRLENSIKILSISFSSSISNFFKSLFKSTTNIGSIKTV